MKIILVNSLTYTCRPTLFNPLESLKQVLNINILSDTFLTQLSYLVQNKALQVLLLSPAMFSKLKK